MRSSKRADTTANEPNGSGCVKPKLLSFSRNNECLASISIVKIDWFRQDFHKKVLGIFSKCTSDTTKSASHKYNKNLGTQDPWHLVLFYFEQRIFIEHRDWFEFVVAF